MEERRCLPLASTTCLFLHTPFSWSHHSIKQRKTTSESACKHAYYILCLLPPIFNNTPPLLCQSSISHPTREYIDIAPQSYFWKKNWKIINIKERVNNKLMSGRGGSLLTVEGTWKVPSESTCKKQKWESSRCELQHIKSIIPLHRLLLAVHSIPFER